MSVPPPRSADWMPLSTERHSLDNRYHSDVSGDKQHDNASTTVAESVPLQDKAEHLAKRHSRNSLKQAKVDSAHLEHGGRRAPWIERIWLWEVGACILAISCLTSIVGVLVYEDDRPLDDWQLIIAPTAVVSFLGTLAKSSTLLATSEVISQSKWLHFRHRPQRLIDLELFDAASRGPWGSANFLLRKHRHVLLASIAAFVVTASLLVDPFVQLVFSFPTVEVNTVGAAPFLLTTNTLDSGLASWRTGQAGLLSTELQASILHGLYQEPYNRQAFCPTSNCTWHNIRTLGICASCSNVTADVQSRSVTGPSGSGRGRQYIFPGERYPQKMINMYSPDYLSTPDETLYTGWNSSAIGLSGSSTIVEIYGVQRLVTGADEDGFPVLSPASCWQCFFEFCSKAYANVTVVNGTTTMTPPAEESLYVHSNSTKLYEYQVTNANETVSGMMMRTQNEDSSAGGMNYTVNVADQSSLFSYMVEIFEAGWSTTDIFWRPLYGMPYYQGVGPNIARSLGQSTDLNATVKAIAESMTQSLRINHNSTQTIGEAFVERTYIKVQWAWLILPIALTVLSCGVLLVAILQTQRQGVVPWKSSGLALLFHDLQGFDVAGEAINSRHALNQTAKRLEGRTTHDADRLAFASNAAFPAETDKV